MADALDSADLTLGGMIAIQAQVRPDALALVEDDRRFDYRRLDITVTRMATALIAQGCAKGDRIALLARNGLEFVLIALGVARAGLVLVPINHRLAADEIAFQLQDSGAAVLIHDGDQAALAIEAARFGSVRLLDTQSRDGDLPAWVGEAAALPAVTGTDLAALFYTSGTTGRPKGAALTHRNLLVVNQLRRTALAWDSWNPDDVCLLVMPFAHIGGFSMVVRTLFFGAAGVVMRDFDAAATLTAIEEFAISKMAAVPIMLQRLVDHPRAATTDFSRLKVINHGAAPIEGELLARADAVIGCGFSQGYGMTETSGVMASLNPADHRRGLSASTGQAMPGVALRIVDDTGAPLETGATGEIQVRAASVMRGYWQRPDDRSIDPDGWLSTGDAGYLDAEGYLFICGRTKDMIVSGGENVFPTEVEDTIAGHPDVAEVAVIGMPDPHWGEVVRAVIVPRPGHAIDPDSIIAWTKARIARFKAPKSVVVVAALPRNALGKVLKNDLRMSQES